jgi:hypothetical protein
MSFFPIGPLRLRLGKDKNLAVTFFGVAIVAPAMGALWWLRCDAWALTQRNMMRTRASRARRQPARSREQRRECVRSMPRSAGRGGDAALRHQGSPAGGRRMMRFRCVCSRARCCRCRSRREKGDPRTRGTVGDDVW